MWRKPWFWSIGGVLLLVVVVATTPQLAQRVGAMGSIWKEAVGSDKHLVPIIQCGNLALRAEHNHAVIERAAHYAATMGSGTKVFMDIARAAAAAESECPRLDEVLDLAVRRTSESYRIIALAESACRIETPVQEAAWQQYYDDLLAGAEYGSIAEALAAGRTGR